MPMDRVYVIGTDEKLVLFKNFLEADVISELVETPSEYSLEQYMVEEGSEFVTRSIRECGIREKTHGLVVGIEREGRRILNPDSTEVIRIGDLLWIVGDREKILALN